MKIALTGGIATGKTTVATLFSNLGAIILDADQFARKAVQPGTPGWRKLCDLLGPDYFEADGSLNRRKLREHIIRDPQRRSQVNAILHPSIIAMMEGAWSTSQATHPGTPVLFDIPLLFEGGFASQFDRIILVYAPAAVQIERLVHRDGVSRAEAEATLRMQMPIESKRALAHIIIDNSKGLEDTRKQVETVWEAVKR